MNEKQTVNSTYTLQKLENTNLRGGNLILSIPIMLRALIGTSGHIKPPLFRGGRIKPSRISI